MPLLTHSQRSRLSDPRAFLWATGIEDTFITAPWPKTGRTLDEYELTGHYERWHDDLGLMRELGVHAARYGIPWHRIQPAPGKWEWDFVDRALDRLLELEIEPIVDLVHYGLPPWIEDAYLHPDFPARMAEYASRVAERFRGRVFAYTPLNEPRITAWYCGRLGWWPPFRRGWRGFVAVMLGACRGIVETVHALRAVDPEILIAHVDATDLYVTDNPALATEAQQRQDIVFLALDLVSGRVAPSHSLWTWLQRQGATLAQLDWLREHAVELPFVGINLYPMFTLKTAQRTARGGLRWRMPYATAEIIERLGTMYWERYDAPVFISETASVGSVRRRREWLEASVAAVRTLRARGVPLVGYTWWPLFALVTWGYRQGTHPPEFYLKQMGLWDLDAELRRIPTPLVEQYRALVAGGASAVGELGHPLDGGKVDPTLPGAPAGTAPSPE
jgi:beta-glucosidase/6-phospho-beta-glucosidase/beta-galactosidase